MFIDAKYRAKETWTDKDGKAFHPGVQYYVGGDTKVYGAALLRCARRTSVKSTTATAFPPHGR